MQAGIARQKGRRADEQLGGSESKAGWTDRQGWWKGGEGRQGRWASWAHQLGGQAGRKVRQDTQESHRRQGKAWPMQLGKTWHSKLTRHSRQAREGRYAQQARYGSSAIGQQARQGRRAGKLQDKACKTDCPAVWQVGSLAVKTDRYGKQTTPERQSNKVGSKVWWVGRQAIRQSCHKGMQPNSGKIHQYRLLF
jgi:hypothetical protein